MFGDDERLRLGQIEHLTGAMADARFRVEARAAHRAGRRVMIDNFVGISDLSQGLAFVTLLPARFFARTFAQAVHPRRLLQSIARRRFATVRTVQSEPALEFGDPRFQGRIFSPQRRIQRDQFFLGRLAWRFANHPILESETASAVQNNLSPIRIAVAQLGSYLGGGLPLFELFNPSRRSSSAIRAFSDAFSAPSAALIAISSSLDGSLGVSQIMRLLNRKPPPPSRTIYRQFESRSPNLGSYGKILCMTEYQAISMGSLAS